MNTPQPELMYLDFGVMLQLSDLSPEFKTCLTKAEAEEMSRKVSAALVQLYPALSEVGMVLVGAGYQVSQIMRPRFPIYHEMTEVSKIQFRAKQFKPSIVTITAVDGEFSVEAFNRDTESPDPLYIFPALLVLPKNEVNQALVSEIETNLSQQGIMTEVLKPLMETALHCEVAHMHMVTLSDISSFYATQLIQINLEPLWEVMKHIIFEMGPTFQVLGSGHLLLWDGKEVVFVVPDEATFLEVFKGNHDDFVHYDQTMKRLKLLLTDHGILFSEFIVTDPQFFLTTQTLESVLEKVK
ncbi:hypothetical protein [Wohlfahrtiimonas chitiniclastica]|uniref:hypothetical protein n=1 Tax=Wohlfahrtiimonas chitiniclastica TaxID=400946 RepID=UPI001BCD05EA|nr:hypothetical protein [Wohlfahrtiimonas chitiniclastica]MBS7820894.1 hypothetical protein [Wohlfahrtiimonas chitiniclastica]MBS7838517.1 hypothetical protein [Wohlfahrtiimonas chitiniclastica]